jgi:hypothetical protein
MTNDDGCHFEQEVSGRSNKETNIRETCKETVYPSRMNALEMGMKTTDNKRGIT